MEEPLHRMARAWTIIFVLVYGQITFLSVNADGPLIAPKFTNEPSDEIAKPGSSVLLRCRAIGSPTPTYSWQRNGKEMTFSGTGRVRLRTSGDLYFEKVDPVQDDATYRCVAEMKKYSYKIVSRKAELKVIAFPKSFKVPPVAAIGFEGGNVRLSASLGNYKPHPVIAWRYKGKGTLTNTDKRFTVLPQGVLQMTGLRQSEDGEVQAIARDPLGSSLIYSPYVKVKVDAARPSGSGLVFLSKPQDHKLRWGKSVILECFGDSPNKIKYSWFKDGKPITMGNRYSEVGDGNFKISYVREEDDAVYKCSMDDGVKQMEATAKLEVQIPPMFTVVPSKQYGRTDDSVTFRYQVRGVPKPTIRWLKDGIKVGSEADYIEAGDGFFTLRGLISGDSGMYQVFALNPLGEAQASAELEVLARGKPVPTTAKLTPTTPEPTTDSLRPGKPENVRTIPMSPTEIIVSWDPPKVTNGKIVRYVVVYYSVPSSAKREIVDGSTTSVRITGLRPSTRYSFKVQAINQVKPSALSQLVTAATLTATVPDKVGSFTSSKPTSNSIFFSWNAPASGPPVTRYVVYYMNMDNAKYKTFNKVTTTTSIKITGLQPSSTYKFWVIPYSGQLMGTRSNEITVRTEKEPPKVPNPIRDLIVTLGSSKVITLSWNAPSGGPTPTRYKVYYEDLDRSLNPLYIETSAVTAFIQNLKGNTRYKVWVVPYAGGVPGPESRKVTIKTPVARPSMAPLDFKATDIGATTIRLRWRGLTDDQAGGELLGYRLKYRKTGQKGTIKTITLGKSSTEFTLGNLEKNTEYTLKIIGYSSAGEGPQSTIVETTADTDPSKKVPIPRDFKVTTDPDHPDIAVLSWRPPITYTGRIKRYDVYYRKESSFDWSVVPVDGDKVTTNISGIELANIYYFKIQGVDDNGKGMMTLPAQFRSMSESSVPGSITDLNISPYPTYLIVDWNPPSASSIVTRGYVVEVTDAATNKVLSSFKLTGRRRTRYSVVKEIEPGRQYHVSVSAFNNAGSGKITKTTTSTPTVKIPVVKVYDIRAGVRDVSFRWTDKNPSMSAYYIKFFTYDSKGMPLERIITVDQREVAITGLNAFTEYKFYIRRQTDQDFPAQPSIIIKTKPAVPSAPLDVTATKDKNFPSWIVLNWQVPEYPNGNIKQYIIRFATDKNLPLSKWNRTETGTNVMTFNVTGLTVGTPYYFKVFAENEAGVGDGSEILDSSTGGIGVPGGMLPGEPGAKSEDELNGKLWWIILLILLLLFLLLLLLLLLYCCCCRRKGEKCCPCCAKFMDKYCWPCLRACCPCCCSGAGGGGGGGAGGGGKKKSVKKNLYVQAPNSVNGFGNHNDAKKKSDLWVNSAGNNEALEMSNIKANGSVQGGAGGLGGGAGGLGGGAGGLGGGAGGLGAAGGMAGAGGAAGAGGYAAGGLAAGAAVGAAAGAGGMAAAGGAGGVAGGTTKAGVKVALPGDTTFISYKTSLQDYCQKVGWLPPYYSTQQGGTGFFSTVSFGGNQSYSSGAVSAGSKQEAEQKAALAALKGIGLIAADSSHGVESNIAVPSPGEPSFISYKCSLHDFCQQCNILPPRFITSRQGNGYTSQVQVGSHTFQTEQHLSASQDAEQFAAYSGLQGLCMIDSGSKYVPNACFTVPGPGDQKFVSFKSSLHDFCQRYKLPPPQYITTQQPQGYSAKLKFGGLFFQSSDYFPTRLEAEQHAAFEALQGLGLLESAVRFGAGDGSRSNGLGSTPSLSSGMVAGTATYKAGSNNKSGSTSQLNYASGQQDIDIPSYRTLNRHTAREARADLDMGTSTLPVSSSQDSSYSKSYSSTIERSYHTTQPVDIPASSSYSRQYPSTATYDVPSKTLQSTEYSYSSKSHTLGGSPTLKRNGGTSTSYAASSSYRGTTTPTLSNTRVFITSDSGGNKGKGYQAMTESRNQYGNDSVGVTSGAGYSTTGGYSVSYQHSQMKSASSTLPRRTQSPYAADAQHQYSTKANTLGGNGRTFVTSTSTTTATDGVPRSASHPALSELEREMQGLEGLIRDLNGITASEQELYA